VAREPGAALGWPRAVVATAVIAAVGVGLLVIVPNLIVTRLVGLGRDWRVTLATVWFFGMLVAFAWLLRRLQARRLI